MIEEAANAEIRFREDFEAGDLYPMEYDELDRSENESEGGDEDGWVFDDYHDYDNVMISFLESIGQDLQFRFDFEWNPELMM